MGGVTGTESPAMPASCPATVSLHDLGHVTLSPGAVQEQLCLAQLRVAPQLGYPSGVPAGIRAHGDRQGTSQLPCTARCQMSPAHGDTALRLSAGPGLQEEQ